MPAVDGEADELAKEVRAHRDEFQVLSAEHMVEWIDKLHEAEGRRSHATPSTALGARLWRALAHDAGE